MKVFLFLIFFFRPSNVTISHAHASSEPIHDHGDSRNATRNNNKKKRKKFGAYQASVDDMMIIKFLDIFGRQVVWNITRWHMPNSDAMYFQFDFACASMNIERGYDVIGSLSFVVAIYD